jgi:hypothetical protein
MHLVGVISDGDPPVIKSGKIEFSPALDHVSA